MNPNHAALRSSRRLQAPENLLKLPFLSPKAKKEPRLAKHLQKQAARLRRKPLKASDLRDMPPNAVFLNRTQIVCSAGSAARAFLSQRRR